jgi:uncharacterized membrane protein YbaN (DUF454 family)|tara:strand:- start:118 stop:498 length:381 start_codon:yes stop_codon:yes gene_type:complete
LIKKYLYISLGFIFVGLGFLGVVVPGIPTTPFILLAAWLFSKSSPKFEKWLLNHKIFGPLIINWKLYRGISKNSKIYAIITVIITFTTTVWFAFSYQIDILLVLGGMILCAFIYTRPVPPINKNNI